MLLFCIVALGGTLLASCGGKASSSKPAAVDLPTRDRAILAQQVDKRVVQATNVFGLDLARRLAQAQPGENVVVSPAGVMQALTLTWNGASGETRTAMTKALRLDEGLTTDEINNSQQVLTELLQKSSPGVRLSMANSLWVQAGWPVRDDYMQLAQKSYSAAVNARDLMSPKTRDEINHWVKQETKGHIPSMVDEPLSDLARLIIVNAVYLNAAWHTPFEESATKDGDFSFGDGSVKRLPMMHQSGRYAYDEEDTYQAVRLPYGEHQLSMLIILPKSGTDRIKLAEQLFAEPDLWTKDFEYASGELALPRFRTEANFTLEKTLAAMGMGAAFDLNTADFSRVADTSLEPIYIKRVLHKTYLDISEKGTEAAAATLVLNEAGSAPPSGKFQMTIDRPFWLAITDDQSHTLLFVGSIEKP